ncbi:MAG: Lrp/AsnC family transcriptional regulator [Methanobacteriota archaeon]
MDALDIRILRTMGLFPYGKVPRGPDALKPGYVAKKIGVTPETVRERIQRMEKAGLIAGYQVYPNLRHLGLEASAYIFVVEDEAKLAGVPQAIKPIDGLLDAFYFLGPEMCVDLAYRGPRDRDRKLHLLSSAMGGAAMHEFYVQDMPRTEEPLSNLDWRILRALRGRARRPLVEVAEDVGVGYRTVKRRHDRMATQGDFFAVPLLDPGKEGGLLPVALLFYLAKDAPRRTPGEILKAYDDRFIQTTVPVSPALGNFDMMAFAESPADVEALRLRGMRIPGVEKVRALLIRGADDHSEWIDDLVEAKVRETAS